MATCAELRTQLMPLLADRQQAASDVVSDEGDLRELESEASHVNPNILAEARARLAADKLALRQIDDHIAELRNALQTQGCFIQPQHILSTDYQNPPHPNDVDALLAQAIALAQQDPSTILGGKFPSRDAEQEWKQVLPVDLKNTAAHNEEHEGPDQLMGATGWVLRPGFSSTDVPFDHPFGFDWEFMLALDQPADEPKRYTFFLTPADQSCNDDSYPEATQQADDFRDPQNRPIIPPGPDDLPSLLGVELDGGLIPRQFSDWRLGGVDQGDRIAVFGRWIVDCGHQIAITRCDDGTDVHPGITAFRTEIHPPLLMAAARVTTRGLAAPSALDSPEFTRVIFTSRPYMVGQRFTTDTGTIYDDTQPDDGPFFSHMVKEVVKVHETLLGIPISSIQVEAHPKIRSLPFRGSHELHLTVRPPSPNQATTTTAAHGPLAVAFQFTVRSGCSVAVSSSGSDEIHVVIKLSQDGYVPPPLPTRHERAWSREELGRMDPAAADGYMTAEEWGFAIHSLFPQLGGLAGAAVSTVILERGILTDEYETDAITSVNILDASHPVVALANNIPDPSQLIILQQQRVELADEVQADRGDLQELLSERTHVNPTILARARAKLSADQVKLKQLDDQIAALGSATAQGVVQDNNQPLPIFGWLEVGFTALQAQP